MTRRFLLSVVFVSLFFALSCPAEAQQPAKKIPKIVLTRPERSGDSAGQTNVAAFLQGMRERGYTEGSNFIIEILWLELQPIPPNLARSDKVIK